MLPCASALVSLEGHVGGAPEDFKGRSLAALEQGDRVKLSDFIGRGFSSLFVGWIGLQSALQVWGYVSQCRISVVSLRFGLHFERRPHTS